MPRISLRELLLIVALVAMAVASLRYASVQLSVLIFLFVAIVFYFAGIVAIADRGPRQVFALGLIFGLAFYAALIAISPIVWSVPLSREFSSSKGNLPTSQLLNYLHSSFYDGIWNRQFMQIGHCWWALLLGYLGGRYARFVYLRRIRESTPLATESS